MWKKKSTQQKQLWNHSGIDLLSKTWEFNAFPKHTSTMQSNLLVVIAAHRQLIINKYSNQEKKRKKIQSLQYLPYNQTVKQLEMFFKVLHTAISVPNFLFQQDRPAMQQIFSCLQHSSINTNTQQKEADWNLSSLLTSHPNMCSLWMTREITSSLQNSNANCTAWSAFGSASPSPDSIPLRNEKFFSTSSKA